MSLEISKEDNVDTAVPQLQLKIEDIESDDDDEFDDSGAEDEDVAEEDIIGDGEVDDGEIEDEDGIDGDEVVDIDESKDESDSEVIYIRYNDVDMKYIYMCVKCNTTWKTDEQK